MYAGARDLPSQSSFAALHVNSGRQCSGVSLLLDQSTPVESSGAGPSSSAQDGRIACQESTLQEPNHAIRSFQCCIELTSQADSLMKVCHERACVSWALKLSLRYICCN